MSVTMIGLDTAKSVFQVHAVDAAGQVVTRRKLRRNELIAFLSMAVRKRVNLARAKSWHKPCGSFSRFSPFDDHWLKAGWQTPVNVVSRQRRGPKASVDWGLSPSHTRPSGLAAGYYPFLPLVRSRRHLGKATDPSPDLRGFSPPPTILREAGSLHGCHGGVRCGASLGARAGRPWARGEADRARGGPAVREKGQEERRGRRGGDLRGRIPAGREVRACQEPGAARRRECQKPGALRRELDCVLAKLSVQHCGPDLKHAVGAAR